MIKTNPFKAGAAMASIMPTPEIIDNTWHPQMAVRFDELGSPLFVKVLALSFDDRCELVLVNLDTISIPRTSGDNLRQAIADSLGIRPQDVIISCTHSHSTPFVEDLRREHPYFDHVRGRRPGRSGAGLGSSSAGLVLGMLALMLSVRPSTSVFRCPAGV